jgi:molybdopterin/thiamine biosynthesis adenylyltransferase
MVEASELRYKVKRTSPVYRVDDTLFVSGYGEATKITDPDGAVGRLLALADGTRTVAELHASLRQHVPSVTRAEVEAALEQLDAAGFMEDASFSPEGLLDEYDLARWERNINFFGSYCTTQQSKYELQHRLKSCRVALLGAGGLGSHLLFDLAAMGVGDVRVVDFDRVELSNLNRQILYTEADIGRPKVLLAAERIRRFNSRMKLEAVSRRLESADDVSSVVYDRDIVICVADRPKMWIINWVNEACVRAGATLISGGLDVQRAMYYTVIPGVTGCVECWKGDVYENDRASAALLEEKRQAQIGGDYSAFCPLVSTIGGFMLAETARVVTGVVPPAAAGRLIEIRFVDFQTRQVESWNRRPDCAVCGNVRASEDRLARAASSAE